MSRATRALERSVERARSQVEGRPLTTSSVHEARKAIKRARAALRLLRPGLPKGVYREQNRLLRDAGRALAPLRNLHSMQAALEGLGAPSPARMRADEERIRGELDLAACLRLLRRPPALPPGAEEADLRDGVRRVYRAGRRAFKRAREAPDATALHEWRKQVKHLLNALEILEEGGRAPKRAERLAERLGEDHDLALLARKAALDARMRKRVRRRRARLQEKAFALGGKLYERKPRRFIGRLR